MTLTQKRLKELLEYNPDTGAWTWCVRTSYRVRIGQFAGCVSSYGYLVIRIDDVLYGAHRLAWLWMTGEWPKEIDHINGLRLDNRWCNLRLANRSQNVANTLTRKSNKSGFKGVTWYPSLRKWSAQITHEKKKIHLGYFDVPEIAHVAYLAAAKRLFGEFAHGGKS